MFSIRYQRETYDDVIEEIKELLYAHWQEVELYQEELKLDPIYERYKTIEDVGMLFIYTAREKVDGRLVGYYISFVDLASHYRTTLVSTNDLVYIHPKYRKGLVGYTLIKNAEQELKKMGVDVVVLGTKANSNLPPLMERLGYKQHDIIYSKVI